MGIKFFDWLKRGSVSAAPAEVTIDQFFEAAPELQIRSLCWDICVNMVANAIGRCEFRTYRDNVEIADREYYLWNIEPNVNQNSTDFLHKLVRSLYAKNEVLIIEGKKHGGLPSLIIADNWDKSSKGPDRQNTYKNVTVGDYTYSRTFAESDVLKLKLNEKNIKSVSLKSNTRLIASSSYIENKYIKTLTIPNSVKYINDYAFYDCYKLSKVTLNKSLKKIGDGNFEKSTSESCVLYVYKNSVGHKYAKYYKYNYKIIK